MANEEGLWRWFMRNLTTNASSWWENDLPTVRESRGHWQSSFSEGVRKQGDSSNEEMHLRTWCGRRCSGKHQNGLHNCSNARHSMLGLRAPTRRAWCPSM